MDKIVTKKKGVEHEYGWFLFSGIFIVSKAYGGNNMQKVL